MAKTKTRLPSGRSKVSILDVVTERFEFTRGQPLPMGVTSVRGGINFSVFSKHATDVSLVLFAPGQSEPLAEFPFSADLVMVTRSRRQAVTIDSQGGGQIVKASISLSRN